MSDYDKRKEKVRPSPAGHARVSQSDTSRQLCAMFVRQEAEKQKEEADKQKEDEEGWTKVTKGPKGAKARPHSEAANRRTLQKEMKKKKRKELLNFYSWQHKNTQKERKCLNSNSFLVPT